MAQGTTFGEQLRRLREAAGPSQGDLGDRAGLITKALGFAIHDGAQGGDAGAR